MLVVGVGVVVSAGRGYFEELGILVKEVYRG